MRCQRRSSRHTKILGTQFPAPCVLPVFKFLEPCHWILGYELAFSHLYLVNFQSLEKELLLLPNQLGLKKQFTYLNEGFDTHCGHTGLWWCGTQVGIAMKVWKLEEIVPLRSCFNGLSFDDKKLLTRKWSFTLPETRETLVLGCILALSNFRYTFV